MFRRKDVRAYTVTFTVLSDFLAMYLAFAIAWWARFQSGLIPFQDTPQVSNYLALVTLWALVLLVVFHLLGLYNIRMPLPFLTEVARVTQGMGISLAALFALNFFLRSQLDFSRLTIFLMAALSMVCLLVLRNGLRRASRGSPKDNHAWDVERKKTGTIQSLQQTGFECDGQKKRDQNERGGA